MSPAQRRQVMRWATDRGRQLDLWAKLATTITLHHPFPPHAALLQGDFPSYRQLPSSILAMYAIFSLIFLYYANQLCAHLLNCVFPQCMSRWIEVGCTTHYFYKICHWCHENLRISLKKNLVTMIRFSAPCTRWLNQKYLHLPNVKKHILQNGVDCTYTRWVHHGEDISVHVN